ncbi:MAG: ComEC/Rec2 family competence protein [Thermoleophilia bacterium]|nr:ComEC/Rec2 family competence protein [Thermoleophilia bacterium]
MSRLLPAHVLVAAAALGLVASDLLRLRVQAILELPAAAAGALLLPVAARLAGAVVLLLLLGWWWGSVRLDTLDRSPLLAQVGRAGHALVEVTGAPRVGRFDLRQPGRVRVFGGQGLDERVQLEFPLGRAPPQGALIDLLAVVRLPRASADGFDERTWLRRQGIHVVLRVDAWKDTGRRRGGLAGAGDRLRAWLRRASVPGLAGERRAVLDGVVLGDDNGLSPELQQAFRRSGLYHLLAVSGQNVVLLAAGMLWLAWAVGIPRAWAHAAAVGAILAYVLAVGPQPSVIRAAVAGAATSVAWLLSRERDPWHVLLLAAVVLLAWNPYTVADAGFQLSFAAVLAIFLAVRPLLRTLEGYPVPARLGAAAAVSAACSVATAPILWLQFGAVPLLGIVANVLVEPVIATLLALAFATAALDPVVPSLAAALASLNGLLAAYVVFCARAVAAVPFAQVRGSGAAIAAACSLGTAAYAWRRWRTSSNRRT